MKKLAAIAVLVLMLSAASVAYAAQFRLYTVSGFVDMLIERGLIPESMQERARSLGRAMERVDDVAEAEKREAEERAAHLEVYASQLIEHGDLQYAVGSDIEGLLLNVKNTGTSTALLTAKRGCQVVYKVYDETGALRYDSATSQRCTTEERVTWALAAGETRMFPIRHNAVDYPLEKGEYRFELEYPEYGKGERTVTVD